MFQEKKLYIPVHTVNEKLIFNLCIFNALPNLHAAKRGYLIMFDACLYMYPSVA